jgi:hypothetical protein
MAITIMGGLLVATILTLLVVPALYALWFRVHSDETRVGDPDLQTFEGKVVPIRIAAECAGPNLHCGPGSHRAMRRFHDLVSSRADARGDIIRLRDQGGHGGGWRRSTRARGDAAAGEPEFTSAARRRAIGPAVHVERSDRRIKVSCL